MDVLVESVCFALCTFENIVELSNCSSTQCTKFLLVGIY